MYYWFIYMALVYVAHGRRFQHFLCDESDGFELPRYLCLTAIDDDMWNDEKIQIDEFFVTPLVATQAINLALETLVPCITKRVRKRIKALGQRDEADRLYTRHGNDMAEHVREQLGLSERQLPCVKKTEDQNAHSAIQLQVESSLAPFDPFGDYMDLSMQCGYVLLFSIAWPLCAVCAAINNLFETQADFFKMTQLRRPEPRSVAGIGQWIEMSKVGVFVAIVLTSLFFTLVTGGAEHFVVGCDTSYWDSKAIMRPTYTTGQAYEPGGSWDADCLSNVDESSTRIMMALGLICINSAAALTIFRLVDSVDPSVAKDQEIYRLLERRVQENYAAIPDLSDELHLAVKHAFMHVTWRSGTPHDTNADITKRYPQLKDPLNDQIDQEQLGDAMKLLLGVELDHARLNSVYREAVLDKDGFVSFSEWAHLFIPDNISNHLKNKVPVLKDPESHFCDPGLPDGIRASWQSPFARTRSRTHG